MKCARMRYLMGGLVEVEADADTRHAAVNAVETAFEELKRVEKLLSKFMPDSVVSRINRLASEEPVAVSPEVFNLLRESLRFSELTEGAFDITVNPLIELWNDACLKDRVPRPHAIREALFRTGHQHIRLDEADHTVFFERPDMEIDLGAIGKGYAVDRAVKILRGRGIRKAMVSTGSTIFCLDDTVSWFGVEHPLERGEIITSMPLRDNAVSTSANSERYQIIGGRRYGHMIDPASGYPVAGDLLSVSVVTTSAMIADVLSTSAFVLGRQAGRRLIARWDCAEAFIL
ncbi:MAG: FAD:protein FMN transferase [Candidatus Omnitrophota bacterium]|nr:FAD:protein FMN transferase [Candidatus Omnitrophota bacterium]